jgi:hypothetical protein
MSKAEDALTARATRAAKRGSDEPAPDAPAAPPAGPRARPARLTLDLSPVQHRALTVWCSDTAYELGLTKVPATSVLRLLVGQLTSDPELAARIRALIPAELA